MSYYQVAGASLATLAALVDKSLVYHRPDGRYRIHELLRQFAVAELDRAGETGFTRERHLAYFLDLAEQAGVRDGVVGMAKNAIPGAEEPAADQGSTRI